MKLLTLETSIVFYSRFFCTPFRNKFRQFGGKIAYSKLTFLILLFIYLLLLVLFFFFFSENYASIQHFLQWGDWGNPPSLPEKLAYPPAILPKKQFFAIFMPVLVILVKMSFPATKGTPVGNPGILNKTSCLNLRRKILKLLISLLNSLTLPNFTLNIK